MSKTSKANIKIIYKIISDDQKKLNKIRIFGNAFYKENNKKCRIKINKKEQDLCEFYDLNNNEKEIEIVLIVNEIITDMHDMFGNCTTLFSITNLSSLDTSEVTDMSFMFFECPSLTQLSDLSYWNISKVTNLGFMFSKCRSLKSINGLTNWDTSNVTDISFMFDQCSSLSDLCDISKWNTSKVIYMNNMFNNCRSLVQRPDISKWIFPKGFIKESIFNDSIDIFEIINKRNKKSLDLNQNSTEELTPEINEFEKNNNFKVLRNDNLKFIPQIDLKFEGQFDINKDMIDSLKNELRNIFGSKKFSIIEVSKGSLKVIITLQFILNKIINRIIEDPTIDKCLNFNKDINNDVNDMANKIMNNKFLCIGNTRPDFVQKSVLDITEPENQNKLKNLFTSYNCNIENKKTNIYENAKNFTAQDFAKLIDLLSDEADKQELNQFTKNFEEFYDTENDLEEALKNSIFEYKIINIYLINRDNTQYKIHKESCPNKEVKLLFHGADPEAIASILSDNFNCFSNTHIFGQGSYFTDSLDYVWYYTGNKRRERFLNFPKVNQTFSFIASEIYYDSTKKEKVYNIDTEDDYVDENGVRCTTVDGISKILKENEIRRHKGFKANEFLISNQNQILPIYAITMKRSDYLIIWRDYNFDTKNPNNYEEEYFKEMLIFNEEIRKFAQREVDSKVYYINTSEESLSLIKRKKYNKIILITNGNNEAKQYIEDARKIIGADCIALVSAYLPEAHFDWVQDFKNTLISNSLDFHKRFIKSVISFDLKGLKILKTDIENHYDIKLKYFNFSELLKYPNFKTNGKFMDLEFE